MSQTTTKRRGVNFAFDRFSGVYILLLFVVVFGAWVPDLFLTGSTVSSIASSQAVAAIIAVALLFPLAGGTFDLSVGATANFATITVVALQTMHGLGMVESIAITVLASALIGAVNSLVIVGLRVGSFIATLGMATMLTAAQSIVSRESQPTPPFNAAWINLTQMEIGGFQIVVLYMLVIAVLAWWVMEHTPVGRYLYAVGGNAEAARLSGVRADRWTCVALIVSSTLSGVAGVFYASVAGPSLTWGSSILLPAFAAVFLGSTQIKPGRVNVWGTILAIFVLAVGVRGLQLVTGVRWLNDMFNGAALIVAVAFAVWRQRRKVTSTESAGRTRNGAAGTVGERGETNENDGPDAQTKPRSPEPSSALPLNNSQI